MIRKLFCLLALTGGCLLILSPSSHAQKEKKEKAEPTKKEIQHERMHQLTTAYGLAEQGRAKNAPEYLITAAGILRHLSSIKDLQEMKKFEVKPEITGDGNPGQDKEVKVPTLREQSDELFKEASDMGAAQGINVDKLIKVARERETTDKEERGVIGGPRAIGLLIGPGQTHTFAFALAPEDFTEWAFRSTSNLHVTIMRADTRATWLNATGRFQSRVWHSQGVAVPIVIRITNQSKAVAQYQMTIQ